MVVVAEVVVEFVVIVIGVSKILSCFFSSRVVFSSLNIRAIEGLAKKII
jgi:hypothetical protein